MSGSDPPPAEAMPPAPSLSSSLFLLPPDAPSLSNDAANSSLVGSPPVPDSPPSLPVVSNDSDSAVTSPPPDSSSPILSAPPENPSPSPPPPPPPSSQPPKSSPASSPPPSLPQSPPPSTLPSVFFPPPALPSSPPPVAPKYSPPPSTQQQSSPPSPTRPLSPPPSPPPPSNSSLVAPLIPAVPSPPPPPLFFVSPPPIEQNSPASDSLPPAVNSTTTLNPTNTSTSSPSNINNSASASVALVPPSHSNTKSPSFSSSSTSSSSQAVENTPSSSSAQKTTVVGAVVAGVVILALIATIFALSRKKKRRPDAYLAPYVPPPNFAVQSDGYYYGQNSSLMAVPGQSGPFFPSQVPHSGNANSFVSQTGNVYQVGGLDSELLTGTKSFYSYEEVMEMTSGFARQNIIGEGGFGSVYKGQLLDGRVVAVKQLKAGSGQGDREFRAEVEIISRVHHRHLVSLVGYCIQDNQRLLIYEFLPNKTLDYHLHSKDQPVLDWEKRLKIAVGSAKGLAYLHEDCHPKIIHRDIKSSNILLDDAFEAQVSDFGLAKLTNDTNTHVSTRVMGTFGYLAPEYASSGKLTDRSDVFSFGVVLLELITGRKPVDPTQPLGDESLVEWSRPLLVQALETGELSEVVDPRLQKHYAESEMLRMIEAAAACIRHSATKRPRMAQVVRALDTDGEMSDLTNGVKYGQSTVYDSGQYSEDILKFRRRALESSDSLDFDLLSREHTSKEVPSTTSWRSRDSSSDFTGSESESRAFNPASSCKR